MVPFGDLLAGYGTTAIGEGLDIESVFALLKVRGEDGRAAWSVRAGGAALSTQELLGVLEGLIASIRARLTRSWKPGATPQHPSVAAPAAPQEPIQFSELVGDMQTPALGDGYLIESVFAVIKSRRADGSPVWHARSAEMKLSSEEQLGALEGYAAGLRQDLAASWNW